MRGINANIPQNRSIGITEVTSLGSGALPAIFAFGLLGRRIARDAEGVEPPQRSTVPVG